MLLAKTKSIHFENVPTDVGTSFTVRQFDWPRFPFNWHYHPEVELTLIVHGRGLRFVGDSVERFADGDLCLLGSNTPHCWASEKETESGVRSLVVQFQPDAWGEGFWRLPELRSVAKLLSDARRGLQIGGSVQREVEQLFSILQQESPGSLLRFNTLLEILHCIALSKDITPLAARNFETPPTAEANGKLGKILSYIHSHLGPDLTQCEVAKAVRLSPAAFSQFFRRSLGTSYVHYVNEIKVRNAARALLDTDQPITEIAYSAGFNNLSHFNVQFRRFRHLSPRAFRKQAQTAERTGVPIEDLTKGLSTLMPATAAMKRDLTIHGKGTTFKGVRLGSEEPRPWLKHFCICPALARYQIVHAGIADTRAPYQIVRTNQTSNYFLACFGGEGQVLVDGQWRIIRSGTACLLPKHMYTAFGTLAEETWQFAYVCHQQLNRLDEPATTPASAPVVAEFDPEPLRLSILGLESECRAINRPTQVDHWIELIQGYVRAFAQPPFAGSPLPGLWQRVAGRLKEPWTPESLAREAGCSRESLRHLCKKELGRSPLEQLISLRLRRATELLTNTNLELKEIAVAVGYLNTVTFSNAFQANIGCRPSDYRQRHLVPQPSRSEL